MRKRKPGKTRLQKTIDAHVGFVRGHGDGLDFCGQRSWLDPLLHCPERGTLADVMTGRVTPPTDRPLVFSPFGLGVLDLAVGTYVYDETARSGRLHVIADFFHDLSRHGTASGPTSA